jgi:hypothetical protein
MVNKDCMAMKNMKQVQKLDANSTKSKDHKNEAKADIYPQ